MLLMESVICIKGVIYNDRKDIGCNSCVDYECLCFRNNDYVWKMKRRDVK